MRYSLCLAFLALAGVRADEAIPAKTLADIKAATAFIKVDQGPIQATGSGFLIKVDGKTGYLITNHHVVVHQGPALPPAKYTVVLHSGTKKEQVLRAELLASDPDPNRDLAVLKVTGDNLPSPLDLAQKVELAETLPVFMFGFPFGQALSLTKGHPAMTIGKGSISSLRLNERDEVGVIQIDGDLNPGNSGGPVVDDKGRLVGVAVARVRATRIGMAIPPTELRRLLAGRVSALGAKANRVDATITEVEITAALIDPLGAMKEIEILHIPARDLKEKPKPDREMLWTLMQGTSKEKLTIDGQRAKGKLRLTSKEKGVVPFNFQITYVRGDGKRLATQMTTHDFDFGEVVVIKPMGKDDPPPPPVILKDKVVQVVPSIHDAVLGGNGRYLILHLGDKRKLLIWDVYQAKLVKELAVASDHIKYAAGIDKLIVVLPDQKLIQRYDLKTFERETTKPFRVNGTVKGVAMGWASHGPLMVGMATDRGTEEGQLFDPLTLQPVEYEWADGKLPHFSSEFLRVSADGQMFTARQGVGGEPHSCMCITLQGRKARTVVAGMSGSMLLPTGDNKLICVENEVLEAEKLKKVFPLRNAADGVAPYIPARQGNYFCRLERGKEKGVGKLVLFVPGHELPIGAIDEVEGHIDAVIAYGKLPNPMMHDKRVFLVPEAKQLITIPLSNDRIVARTVDLEQILRDAPFDFLFVTSAPPGSARESTKYTYQVAAKSNKGGIKYKLESGPKGMTVSAQGLVEWEVPKRNERKEHEVVVGVTDAAGQECFHSFTIVID